jgi:hypothetical protein
MQNRDAHSALKSEVIRKVNAGHLEIVLARLQWGKDDKAWNLHVNPTSFSTAGLQSTDWLAYLGFQRNDRCSFTSFQRCYSKWVNEDFNVEEFATGFNAGFGHLDKAQRALQACGFNLPQPEGWGFYNDKPSGRSYRTPGISGDGHIAVKVEQMKATEDDRFLFHFTFIDTGREKAFVTHYRPKHFPLSSELGGVFKYLGLREFNECPEFDFEPCFFRTLQFQTRGNDMWDSNVESAHRAFDALATQFSPGIESLLAANAAIESVGMTFLPFTKPAERMRADIATKVVRPSKLATATLAQSASSKRPSPTLPDSFDVAVSFAGPERESARQLAEILRAGGYAVFYDDFFPEQLWGKNLQVFFDEIFRKKARFCVMFVSKEYQQRVWTNHEARSAQARALEEKGNEYILPIQVDGTELEGLLPTIGYIPIGIGIEKIGEMLINKLSGK